jgi:hypothetical protein
MKDIGIDAAAVLYWEPEEVSAGGSRLLGFALGSGPVRLGDPPPKP